MSARDSLTDCMVVAQGVDGQYTVEFERGGALVRALCMGAPVQIGETIQVNENLGTLHLTQVNDLNVLG